MRKLLLASAALCALGGAARADDGRGCSVTVYIDWNFGGYQQTYTGTDILRFGSNWNDQISSIRVHRGVVRFYGDQNFGGAVSEYGVGDYAQVPNDQFSSFRCVMGG